jgi:DNA polymerase-4
MAAEIRTRIFDETGLTASAGISYNKFLAKLASDRRKPNGQFVVTPAMGAAFVEVLPVGKLHGVGPVTADGMNRLGIFTGADLRRQSLAFLQQHFGKAGPWYHAIANGDDDRPVVPDRPCRSSGSETTFSSDLTDPADIEAGVQAMADKVWAWCEKARAFGRTVTVKIKYADFQQATRSRTLPATVTSQETLRDVSIGVRTVFPPAKGIRLVGVTLSSFERPDRTLSEQFELGLGNALAHDNVLGDDPRRTNKAQRSAMTEWPPITRQYSRFVGEFVVSFAFTHLPTILDKSLI